MNWIQTIRQRFENSPAEIHGKWVCEAGDSRCDLDFRSIPSNSMILGVDLLNDTDVQVHSSIDREKHCDYVVFGCDKHRPYLMLIEVKGGKRAKPSRIRQAKQQIRSSEKIAIALYRNCQEPPRGLDKFHVVVTRRVRPTTLNRWINQRDGKELLRDIILVFSGDDIWQEIQRNTI